jgi:hypothetical protein
VQFYTRQFLPEDSLCAKLRDCRRLPKFIGRIQRTPILLCQAKSEDVFTTLDKIDVFQRDIRQVGSNTTKLNTVYVISTWDNDGMPNLLQTLENDNHNIISWKRKAIKGFPVSYIYCLPVWQSRTDFIYSVESEEHEVGYALQPWNYAAYLPKGIFDFPPEEDMNPNSV